MRKLAFIASGHSGSTIPLAHEYIMMGYSVDIYILTNKVINCPEATDIQYTTRKHGVTEIPKLYWPKLSKYINSTRFRIFCISTERPFESNTLLNKAIGIYRSIQIRRICKFLNHQNYDFVNIIGRYKVSDIPRYASHLTSRIIVSLHEVCDHNEPNFEKPNIILQYLFKKKINIVVFSEKSMKDLVHYTGACAEKIHHINFGLFTSYSIFSGNRALQLPNEYCLFIGRITNYKGLCFFVDAAKKCPNREFVIAGSGYDLSLEQAKLHPNLKIINRFLSNQEFVELIERSRFLVCPYTSISQSGIPQACFVFNKPIIATNLDGFKEIIINEINGLLFSLNDTTILSKKIEELFYNNNLYNKLSKGVSSFEKMKSDYAWSTIANLYIEKFLK